MHNGSHLQSRSKWLIAATVAVAVVAGGLAIGSNMGFKYNAVITGAAPAPKGDNWFSFPDNNPYPKASNICTSLGLTTTGLNTGRAIVSRMITSSGTLQSYTCGTATATAFNTIKGEAFRIRQPNTPSLNAIIVGSDDPVNTVAIETGSPAPKGDNWRSVPYHTTAVKASDLCIDMGLITTGLNSGRGTLSRLVTSTGSLNTYTCGTTTATAFPITVGEGVRIRSTVAKSWLASHF